jgi:two-component system sensor histidine kinase/response regulator
MISDIKKQYLHCLSILLFASILIFFAVSQASALEEVTLQLKWTHQFQFAGYYAALQQGYYRDAGLDVTIKPATPGKDPVLDVIDGR